MTAIRFLHTSDLHLGKPFAWSAEADRLRVARRAVLSRLVEAARAQGAPHVLVAGDLFETPNPAPATWRQAVAEMAEAADLSWWLLPGNHDNLREARATWEAIRDLGHRNVRVLAEPEPVTLQEGAVLLPAPLAVRRPATDPTAWMAGCETGPEVVRIGLAHGPVQGFGEGEMPADIIAPDRWRSARLDYLALGDWHGRMRLSERAWYSGTPEQDRFKHDGRGGCLLVEIARPGAAPTVTPIETGAFDWRVLPLELLPGDDPGERLAAALPGGARRDVLVRVVATGRSHLAETSALVALCERLGPDFCHFELDMAGLGTEIDAADLDAIAPGGALRKAGDRLAAEAEDPTLSARDREVAAAALRRLHSLVAEGGA